MGYSLHAVDNLGAPFLMVDECVFLIPQGGLVRIRKLQFKLLFILGGQIEHEIEGMEGRRKLGPGDVLVAPHVRNHFYINANPKKAVSVHVVRLFFDAEHLEKRSRRRGRKPEIDLSDYLLHHFTKVQQITGGIDTEVTGLLTELRREMETKAAGYRHRVKSLCMDLIVLISRKSIGGAEVRSEPKGVPSWHIVVGTKEYVLKNLYRDLTLGEVAWHVGKAEEHLARVFKRETGRSVFDYVREARVTHAQTLLMDPALTLTDIAERCGFNSLSFFSRTFRRLVGMSPSAYRRRTKAVINSKVGGQAITKGFAQQPRERA